MPRLTIAIVVVALAALAGTMTYAGFLVVGRLADFLGIGRVMAGLLLGALFARFPKFSKGKFRTVGLLPKPARRPIIVSLLALCLVSFLSRGEHGPALVTGFATVFLLAFPWIRRAIFDRLLSSLSKFIGGRTPPVRRDGAVIDVELTEKKD